MGVWIENGWGTNANSHPLLLRQAQHEGILLWPHPELVEGRGGVPEGVLHWTPVKEAKTQEARAFWQRGIR